MYTAMFTEHKKILISKNNFIDCLTRTSLQHNNNKKNNKTKNNEEPQNNSGFH